MIPRPTVIAALNDAFRVTLGAPRNGITIPGHCIVTAGIDALSTEAKIEILSQVQRFEGFTEDNDPYGEHDFGAIDHPEVGKVFWKIDYYDPTYTKGSENPCDLTLTARVLTLMLASEY